MKDIVSIVCKYYDIPIHRLYTKHRQRQFIIIAKQMCLLLIKDFIPNITYQHIGMHFNRHHATIISGLNTIKGELDISSIRREEYKKLRALVAKVDIHLEQDIFEKLNCNRCNYKFS